MTTPKRVVHITTVHHPTDPRIFHKQCKSLIKAGFELYYIAKDDPSMAQVKSLHHIPVKNYKNRFTRMIFGSIAAYKKAKKLKADIYHFHDPELIFVASLLKSKRNRVIYDIHEDYVTSLLQKEYLPKPIRKVFARMYTWIERLLIRKMDLSLAEKYYYDIYNRGKLILNYPIINDEYLNFERETERIVPKLLYTGNVTEDRGALIHAGIPSINKKVSVHFVGRCSKALSKKMLEQAKNGKDRIHITGIDRFVEKQDIDQMYFKYDWLAGIALFPPTEHYMKKELTKFFEYMNAGLPIICSDFPVWEKFINSHNCGIVVDPKNPKEINEAITYLLNHPEEARKMGENGKRAIIDQLSWEKEEKKLINWYNELLQQKDGTVNID